jgi:hypothetical protein
VLSARQLNRALLARNLLLERSSLDVAAAVSRLVALQAQEPLEPFVGLWSRLASFTPADLDAALLGKRVVRTLLMRRTVHLVTAEDALALRPVHQAMLVQRSTTLRAAGPSVDLAAVAAVARAVVEAEPSTLRAVGRAVAERWPALASPQLGDAVVTLVPLVQLPPRGTWGGPQLPSANATMRQWLGRDPAAGDPADLEAMVLRYLRAFGPASTSDLRSWCGIAGLPPVVEALAPHLRTFRDERGRTLLDVEDGLLPDPDTPVPPRFLPAFDNAVLGYDDRSRIIDDEHKGLSVLGARYVLVDGRVAGTWTRPKGTATVEITPLVELRPRRGRRRRPAPGGVPRRRRPRGRRPLALGRLSGADGRFHPVFDEVVGQRHRP